MQKKYSDNGSRIIALTISASLIYGISAGIRSNYGILLLPIAENSGVDYAAVSFVLEVAQLVFGIMQPVFGVIGMKRSNLFVLRSGIVLMVAGLLLIPVCRSVWSLMLTLGFILPSGTAALSFGIVMGAVSPQLPPKVAPTTAGIITASSGLVSTILSPLVQILVTFSGLIGAMMFLGVPTLLLLPVSAFICRRNMMIEETVNTGKQANPAIREMLQKALSSKNYIYLLAGFFTCGFHMSIIETHLFTQITTYGFTRNAAALVYSVYGIMVMVGSVISGMLCGKFAMKNVLGSLYSIRCFIILAFLLLPKSVISIYGFAVLLGLTSAATVPPTSGITERIFGAAKLATMFGIVFFAHQIGSFFSAWLGGVGISLTGSYTLLWVADIFLCLAAAAFSFKIKSGKKDRI